MPNFAPTFDLSGFTFTDKSDHVTVFADITAGTIGIRNTTSVDTLAGNDVIEARLNLSAGDGSAGSVQAVLVAHQIPMGAGADEVIGAVSAHLGNDASWALDGINVSDAPLITGDGRDLVKGKVVIHAGTNFVGDNQGIDNRDGTIATGAGHDEVIGAIRIWAGDYTATKVLGTDGILGGHSLVETGDGNDCVTGAASFRGGGVAATGDVTATVSGIHGETITTGLGNDSVSGVAKASLGNVASGGLVNEKAVGINDVAITTGAGCDEIIGRGIATVHAGGPAQGDGIYAGTISTGDGNDWISGSGFASGQFATARGFGYNSSDLGAGNDTLEATARAVGATATAFAIAFTTKLDMGDGDDCVIADAKIAGSSSNSSLVFGINDGSIDLGAGNDRLEARAESCGPGFAAGILQATIQAGDGRDYISAEGRATGAGSEGYGIVGGRVDLGAGNDWLVARGSTAGLSSATLLGGAGNDTFDLGSGTGSIDGGADRDLLILDGKWTSYTFTHGVDPGTGTIVNAANGTNLSVSNLESFKFCNGTFSFGTLFGGP
jgi:hypothetical protein